jgi:hypothetical protein
MGVGGLWPCLPQSSECIGRPIWCPVHGIPGSKDGGPVSLIRKS